MAFSWKDRAASIASLATNPPELLIIGAGVVGSSVAAHAARLGLNVVVVEKDDIASGASGNSTGLAHAGLRYLAQGHVGYVFKESRERHRLQELAPHWVRPFNFILPVYRGDPYKFWMARLGTWIYDFLGWLDAYLTKRPMVRRHRTLSAAEVRAKVPGVRSEDLLGGLEYYVDARLQDSRFTLGYTQQAATLGARIITHCQVLTVTGGGEGAPPVVLLRDALTQHTFQCSASLVLNAAGAWIDGIRENADFAKPVVQKSKGVHLIVDHITDSPLIMSSAMKGKVFFIIPIDHERTLIGTTDSAVQGDPDQLGADPKDVMELLQQLFHYFPYLKQGSNLLEAIEGYKQVHVRDAYWAVRPLLAQGKSTLDASREHRLVKDLPNFWSFPGVKLTAGRSAGEQAAREAWAYLRKGIKAPVVTWDSLPGGELWDVQRFVRDAQKRFMLGDNSEKKIEYLVTLYGTRYVEVLQWAQLETSFDQPIVPGEPWILAQAAFAAHEEMVVTLNDFLWRRVKWAHYMDLPDEAIKAISDTLGRFLEWSTEEKALQIRSYREELKKHRLI